MQFLTGLERRLPRFRRDTHGTIAILLALSAVPLLLVTGASMDIVRASSVKARLQVAVDAGALAAAASAGQGTAERIRKANIVFHAYYPGNHNALGSPATSVEITTDGVKMDASITIPTAFMGITGIASMKLGSSAVVRLPGAAAAPATAMPSQRHIRTISATGRVTRAASTETASPAGFRVRCKQRISSKPVSEQPVLCGL